MVEHSLHTLRAFLFGPPEGFAMTPSFIQGRFFHYHWTEPLVIDRAVHTHSGLGWFSTEPFMSQISLNLLEMFQFMVGTVLVGKHASKQQTWQLE